jgi:hypothetical protein
MDTCTYIHHICIIILLPFYTSSTLLGRPAGTDPSLLIYNYYTPKTKKQSQQRIKRSQLGPINVQASQTKQMLLAFSYSKVLIYGHIMPRGASTITIYIINVLGSFMKLLRINKLEMVSWEWFSTG